ncbi:MAG: prepilin-type N-terminal cleavage/methylation domain-containing protein [Planctomycetota bacterium]
MIARVLPPGRASAGTTHASSGFTLLELLIATSIFVVIGSMIFGIMRSSMTVWSVGETERDMRERAEAVLDRIADDLRLTYARNPDGVTPPPVQFVCDWVAMDRDRDGLLDMRVQRLRFVRANVEERLNELMIGAGEDPLASQWFNLIDDQDRRASGAFLPTGGLAEICYVTIPPPTDRSTGSLVVARAYHSPIGGASSLLSDDYLGLPGTFANEFLPLAGEVLYLGFRFRTTRGDTFEVNGLATGGSMTWDSTRAKAAKTGGVGAFLFSQADDQRALERTEDDVYPFEVQVTVIVARPADEEHMTELTESIAADRAQPELHVRSSSFVRDNPGTEGLLKVDEEWLRVRRVDRDLIVAGERGLLGSPACPHARGAPVRQGIVYRKVVPIPCYREDWNS